MKRIIAVLLSVIAILTFTVVPAFSEEDAIDKNFEFASVFGFVDGDNFAPEDVISRIELAEVFYNIVFPTQNIESSFWGDGDFPDVPAAKKHIASAVYGMGVMRGYSDSIFAPDDIVTYNQLVKTMVSFLGYDLMAQNMGGYPSGYLAQATRLQILPGGNISGNEEVTYAMVAKMLKQSIGVDIAIWNHTGTDGTAVLDVQEDVDYLEYYRNIHVGKGTVTANYLTNLNGDKETRYFDVKINSEPMSVGEWAISLQDLLGYEVIVYYEVSDMGKLILYYEETPNANAVKLDAGQIASVSESSTGNIKISYYISEYDLSEITLSRSATAIYNGAFLSSYSIADINPFSDASKMVDGGITLLDKDGSGDYDTVIIDAFETYIVNSVIDNVIYTYDTPSNGSIDISNYKERNIDILNVLGEPLTPDVIKKGHIISVYKENTPEKKVKRMIVSKDVTSGIVEEIEKQGNKISAITVNGVRFETSGALKIFDNKNQLAPGVSVDLYFSPLRKVAYIDVDSNLTAGYKLGILVDTGTYGGLNSEVDVLIFDSAGEMATYKFKNTVTVTSNGVSTIKNSDEIIDYLGRGNNNRIVRQLVHYKVDAENRVYSILLPDTTGASSDGFYKFTEPADNAYTFQLAFRTFNGEVLLNADATILQMPPESKRDDYKKYAVASLPKGEGTETLTATLFGTDKAGFVADYVLIETDNSYAAGGSKPHLEPVFYVRNVATVLNDDGEERLKYSGIYWQNQSISEGTFLADTNMFTNSIGRIPVVGDVIRVPAFVNQGEIVDYNLAHVVDVYNFTTKKLGSGTGTFTDSLSSVASEKGTYSIGKVLKKSGDGIMVQLEGTNEIKVLSTSANYFKIFELKEDARGEFVSVKNSTHDCIVSDEDRPGNPSRIIIHERTAFGVTLTVLN